MLLHTVGYATPHKKADAQLRDREEGVDVPDCIPELDLKVKGDRPVMHEEILNCMLCASSGSPIRRTWMWEPKCTFFCLFIHFILYNIDLKANRRSRSCHAGQWLILIERARRTLSYWRHVTCIWVGFESEPGGCLGSFVRYFPRGQRGCNPNGRTRTAAIGIGLSARLFSWLPLKLRSAEDSEQDGAVCGWSFDEDDLERSGRSRRGSIIKAVCPHRPRGQLSSFLWFVFSLTGSPRTNSRRSPLCPLPLCLFFTALPWRERYHPGSNFLHYNVDVRRLIPVNYSAVPTERPVGSTVQKSLVLSPDLGAISDTGPASFAGL